MSSKGSGNTPFLPPVLSRAVEVLRFSTLLVVAELSSPPKDRLGVTGGEVTVFFSISPRRSAARF